jgi:hypothetical protein
MRIVASPRPTSHKNNKILLVAHRSLDRLVRLQSRKEDIIRVGSFTVAAVMAILCYAMRREENFQNLAVSVRVLTPTCQVLLVTSFVLSSRNKKGVAAVEGKRAEVEMSGGATLNISPGFL